MRSRRMDCSAVEENDEDLEEQETETHSSFYIREHQTKRTHV